MLAVMPNLGVGPSYNSGSYSHVNSTARDPIAAGLSSPLFAAEAAISQEAEAKLARLLVLSAVEDVLGEPVGPDDNLIDMGMHSVQVGSWAL